MAYRHFKPEEIRARFKNIRVWFEEVEYWKRRHIVNNIWTSSLPLEEFEGWFKELQYVLGIEHIDNPYRNLSMTERYRLAYEDIKVWMKENADPKPYGSKGALKSYARKAAYKYFDNNAAFSKGFGEDFAIKSDMEKKAETLRKEYERKKGEDYDREFKKSQKKIRR